MRNREDLNTCCDISKFLSFTVVYVQTKERQERMSLTFLLVAFNGLIMRRTTQPSMKKTSLTK